jgi:N-formylglutamate deformylase
METVRGGREGVSGLAGSAKHELDRALTQSAGLTSQVDVQAHDEALAGGHADHSGMPRATGQLRRRMRSRPVAGKRRTMIFAGRPSGLINGAQAAAGVVSTSVVSMSGYRSVPGAACSPVVLHVPHAARHIPASARGRIVLDDAALALELDRMTDTDTDRLAACAAGAAGERPWVMENLVSRLVVDPERFPDEREEMREVGMGAVYTRTSHGEELRAEDPADTRLLLAEYFDPYAQAMTDVVEDRLAATGRAVIIDVHSYPSRALPYERHAAGARPAVCLGTDDFHTPGWLVDAARAAFDECGGIALNTPFSGCYVPLRHYRSSREVGALMIEIRRDTYLREPAGPQTAGFRALAGALTVLIDRASSPHREGR